MKIFSGTSASGFPKVSDFDMCGGTLSPGDCKAFVRYHVGWFCYISMAKPESIETPKNIEYKRRLISDSKNGVATKTEDDIATFVHMHLSTQHRRLAEHYKGVQ